MMIEEGVEENEIPAGGVDLDNYLKGLSDEGLLVLKSDVQEDIGEIKEQLSEARARVHVTGKYADGDWYRRAMSAQRIKANQYNAACVEQGRRRRASRGEVGVKAAVRRDSGRWQGEICKAARDAAEKIIPDHVHCEGDPDCDLFAQREYVARIIQTDIVDRMNADHATDLGG